MSSNINPTTGHKNLVSLLSILVLNCLVTCTPLNLPSTTSLTSLPYGALLTVIFQHFGVDCPNEASDSSSKPFDKLTVAKSLRQSGRASLIRDSDSESSEETNVLGSPPKARAARLSLSSIMNQLMA